MAITGASRKIAGLFYDNGGGVFDVEHPDFGAKGDWNGTTGTDDTAAILAALGAGRTVRLMKNAVHLISGPLTWTGGGTLITNGAEFYNIDATASADTLLVQGTTPAVYTPIDANAVKGQSVITCAALAASLSGGDYIKIKSNLNFNVAEGSIQGETHLVQNVVGNDIYLSSPLFDTYNTADTARIAKVDFAPFQTIGKVKIRRPFNNTLSARGLHLKFIKNAHAAAAVVNCLDRAIVVEDCYSPDMAFYAGNAVRSTSSAGYGLEIINATMFGRFSGFSENCRHTVTHGASPADGGVPWENKIYETTGAGGYASVVFDAHASCGSVEFDQCTAIGYLHTKADGVQVRSQGWNLGARRIKLTRCKGLGLDIVASIDTDATLIENLDVDIKAIDCANHGLTVNVAGLTIQKLTANISGELGSAANMFAVWLASFTAIQEWDITANLLKGAGMVYVAGSGTTPATLRVKGRTKGPGNPGSADTTLAAVRLNNANVTKVVMDANEISGMGIGVYSQTAVKVKVIDAEWSDIFVAGWHTAIPSQIEVYDSEIAQTDAGATHGLFNVTVAGTVSLLVVSGLVQPVGAFVLGHTGSVAEIVRSSNKISGGYARTLASAWRDSSFQLPSMTTTQRDAIVSPPDGMLIYNSTTGAVNARTAGAWTAL